MKSWKLRLGIEIPIGVDEYTRKEIGKVRGKKIGKETCEITGMGVSSHPFRELVK